MIKTSKPQTARGKRALKAKEAKVFENVKNCLFLRGNKSSNVVGQALKDFAKLKKPYAVTFGQKNDIHPFEDDSKLEFFGKKNDTSMFMLATHSKKRPNTLTLGRLFDGHLLDMMELTLSNYAPMSAFEVNGCGFGKKPVFVFSGDKFETSQQHQQLKSMLLDLYRGETMEEVALNGLEHVISLTAVEEKVLFRVYQIQLKKSGTKIPRIELVEMGPRCDISIGRIKMPNEDAWKEATREPKEAKITKVKNVVKDDIGDKFGKIHVGRQDIEKLQTRKMKGLKRSSGEHEEEEEDSGNKTQKLQ